MTTHKTQDILAWTQMTSRDITRRAACAILERQAGLDRILAISAKNRTYANTVAAYDQITAPYNDLCGQLDLLASVASASRVAAAQKARHALTVAALTMDDDPRLFAAICAVRDTRRGIHTEQQQRLTEECYQDLLRLGVNLSQKQRRRLHSLRTAMVRVAQEFEHRINTHEDSILVTRGDLAGVPEDVIARFQRVDGRYRITLAYPQSIPVLTHARNQNVRKALFIKTLRRGGKRNCTLLRRMLAYRTEVAQILGYATHADYACADRMAKNAKTVAAFLTRIIGHVRGAARADLRCLAAYKKSDGFSSALAPWDIGYYANRLAQDTYAIDQEQVRAYFPFAHVQKVFFAMLAEVFDVTMVPQMVPHTLWHKDACLYAVMVGKVVRGYIIFDLFPRKGKYGHAAMFPLITGRGRGAKRVHPLCAVVTNFPRDTKKHPACLTHREVETFFHECGHALHHVLSRTQHAAQSGTNVAWDFVETPSQLMEYWAWDHALLRRMTMHVRTGLPMPDAMIDRLCASRWHMHGWDTLRTAVIALWDLHIHTKKVSDPVAIYGAFYARWMGITLPRQQLFPASFGHIMGGYDAGYYSYLWAQVFAADCATQFAVRGFMDRATARSYRTQILESGSARPEAASLAAFLGRPAQTDAFFAECDAAAHRTANRKRSENTLK